MRDTEPNHPSGQSLRNGYKRMHRAADAARLGLFEWTVVKDQTIWENDYSYEIFGRKPEQGPLNSASFLEECLLPEDREKLEKLAETIDGDSHFTVACRIRHQSSDEIRWVTFSGEVEYGEDGHPVKVLGVVRDITESKRREHHSALFSEVSKKITELAEAKEVFIYVSQRLEEYLEIDHCLFTDINDEHDEAHVSYCHHAKDAVANLSGDYKLSEFLDEKMMADLRRGESVAIDDAADFDYSKALTNAPLRIRSAVNLPFLSMGRWKYLLSLAANVPRKWRKDELVLLRKIMDLLSLRIEGVRAEANLKESESKLRMLFQDVPANISVHEGPEHRFIFTNEFHDQTAGPRDFIGKSLKDIMPELVGQDIIEKFDKVFREGKSLRTNQLGANLSEDEDKRYFHQVLMPWYSDGKDPAGVMGFSYEITDLVKKGRLLEESERRLQLATKASDLGIYDFDIPKDFIEWDSVLYDLWGIDEDTKITLEVFFEGVHPDDREATQLALDRSMDPESEGRYEAEYRVINKKSGETKWIEAIGKTYFKDGKPVKLLGSVRDITEEKNAKAALAQSEERYRNLFNSIDEGFAIVEVLYDEKDNPTDILFISANPAFAKHSGIENVVGKTVRDLNPSTESFWIKLYDEVVKTHSPQNVERYSEAYGRWFFVNASPVGGEEKNKVAVVFSDVTAYKNAELALQESEKKFRLIADITPEMIWVTDAEGKVEFLNRQWYNFSGTEPGQKTASEVAEKSIHPEDAPKVMEAFANAIKTGKQFAISQRNRRADGKYRRFLNRGVPYHDPETGEITKWYGISTDIEDLKSAEERYRLLVESIDAGFCIIKMVYNEEGNPIDYVFVDHNPAFAMHIPLPDPIGRSMLEMVPDHENYWLDLYSEVDKTGESVRYENHAQALDRYYSGFAFSIESDEGLVGVLFEDITHKRKVEEQIKNSEERLRLASDAAGLGTYEYDVYRDKFIWSPEVYKLYDVTQDAEPTKEIIHERIHPDDFVRFEKSVANTLSTRSDEINKNIYRIKTRKGAIRWVRDVNKAFYSEEDNQVVRIIGTIHDITETKLAEEALHETAQRKDEFLAMLAHELRNPLSPMKSAIDLMRTGSNEEEEVKARDIIERQVDKLIRLIDDLMDISRISKNRIKLQQRGMDLREALEVAIETAAPLIKERRHQFKADLPDVPVPIRADLDRLIQVITNLLTNAAKYTPEGGRISVKLKTENEQALIEVEDNGVGISGEDKTVIFEIFRQVGNQNSGLGIGLSLVKTLVEMHRGEVSVRSEGRDRGSTFTISLPLNERDFALKSDNNVQKTIEGNPEKEKLRILVVDDNKDGADLLQMALSRKGFEVEKTYTGGEGVSKAIEFHPQVALLDIGLPDISGYEVAKQLRKHFPNMVLIAHSGWGQAKDRERALEAGFDHHLIKPVNVSKIVELLQVK